MEENSLSSNKKDNIIYILSEYETVCNKLEKCINNLHSMMLKFKEIYIEQLISEKSDIEPNEKIELAVKKCFRYDDNTLNNLYDIIYRLSIDDKIKIVTGLCKKNMFFQFSYLVNSKKICIGSTKTYYLDDFTNKMDEIDEIRYILMIISKFGTDVFLNSFEEIYLINISTRNIRLSCHYYIGLIERGLCKRLNNIGIFNKLGFLREISREIGSMDEYCNYINTINYLIDKEKLQDTIQSGFDFERIAHGNYNNYVCAMIFLRRVIEKCKSITDCSVNSKISYDMSHYAEEKNTQKFIYYLIENNLHRLKGMNITNISEFEIKYNKKKKYYENILKKSIFPKDLNSVILKYIGIYDTILAK